MTDYSMHVFFVDWWFRLPISVSCCGCCTGESSFEMNIEADGNSVTECPLDGKPRPYLCTVCDKRFMRKSHLTAHKQIHTGEKSYNCTECDKQFTNQRYWRRHMNVHSSKYTCTECGKCFRNNSDVKIHQRIHSAGNAVQRGRTRSSEKVYKCYLCDKAFSQCGNLSRHVVSIHTGYRPYKCPLCERAFSQYSSLQSHTQHMHSDSRPFQCPNCGKLFKSSLQMKRHVRIHTGAKPYSCRHCSVRLGSSHQLKAHLLKSHDEGTWFVCHVCPKKFVSNARLQRHVVRHEAVKPYLCSRCSKSFYTAGDLKLHEPVHSDVKQFCCGACGKLFRHKHTIARHFKRCFSDAPTSSSWAEAPPAYQVIHQPRVWQVRRWHRHCSPWLHQRQAQKLLMITVIFRWVVRVWLILNWGLGTVLGMTLNIVDINVFIQRLQTFFFIFVMFFNVFLNIFWTFFVHLCSETLTSKNIAVVHVVNIFDISFTL